MECYCCLLRPAVKDLKTPYTRLGITEIYSDMIKECFEVHLILSNDRGCGICEVCIGRLQDAKDFKLQVQRSQAELRERLRRAWDVKDEVKSETSERSPSNEGNQEYDPTTDLKTENEIDIKTAEVSFSPFAELEQLIAETSPFQMTSDGVSPTHAGISDDDEAYWEHNETCTEPENSNINFPLKLSEASVKKKAAKHYKCEICNKTFPSSSRLHGHKVVHTTEKPFTCDVCDKPFKYKAHMTRHELTHIKKKPYKCTDCKKAFAHVSLLRLHEMSHKKEIFCEICGKQFSSRSLLITHQRSHTGEKPYTCDVCKKRFAIKGTLVTHMRSHTGYQPYSCQICARKFADPSSFRRHKLIHKEDRPTYTCEICYKEFRAKQKLNTHRLIHTGEKPHTCDICGKCFRSKCNFRTHLQIHEKGMTYSCELCPKSYPTKESLRQHKRVHSKKTATLERN